jgi:hypothetical protein
MPHQPVIGDEPPLDASRKIVNNSRTERNGRKDGIG